MKQTLSIRLGQQLTMTPQLQQAIRLLQLSCLDLQQEIQETLEVNPMLELDDDESSAANDADPISDPSSDSSSDSSSEGVESEDPLTSVDADLEQPSRKIYRWIPPGKKSTNLPPHPAVAAAVRVRSGTVRTATPVASRSRTICTGS